MTALSFLDNMLVIEPSIYDYEGAELGDNPETHRWRAGWCFDWDGQCAGIELTPYPVIKLTRCGAWINEHGTRQATKQPWEEGAPAKAWVPFNPELMTKRFINNNSSAGWAKPTREEALNSLSIRLCRWTDHIRRDAERAKKAIMALQKLRPQDELSVKVSLNNLKNQDTEFYA